MSFLPQNTLLRALSPLVVCRRHRGKINIQRPREPHFDRALYIKLTEPYFAPVKKHLPPVETCRKGYKRIDPHPDNPYEHIVAAECLEWFCKSKLVGVFHQNPMSAGEIFKAKVAFKRAGKIHLCQYGKRVMQLALEEGPFRALLDYYSGHNMMAFSQAGDVGELMKAAKKTPRLVLLYGVYEGRFLSRDDMVKLSQIPDLRTAQSSLVQTIQSCSSRLVENLNAHQNNLVRLLDERGKQLE